MLGFNVLLKFTGFLYLDTKMLFESNESLLNNLKEGVLIVQEDDYSIQFLNKAAQRINRLLQKRCSFTLCKDGFVQFREQRFQQIDEKVIKVGDYESIIRMLDHQCPETSLQNIIK